MLSGNSIRHYANRLRSTARQWVRETYARLPFQGVKGPVFILGCGRSGTTILGRTLQQHNRITYLNERRDLWAAAYPETDIWSSQAKNRGGALQLKAQDSESSRSRRLSRYFLFQAKKTGRPVLVEKLPINNFRVGLIAEAFPDARFIHIYRNGLEVARSIAERDRQNGWFRENEYRWGLLVDYASEAPKTSTLPGLVDTPYEKGLLEWRLSTEAAVQSLSKMPEESFIEVSYSDFVANPVDSIDEVLDFFGLNPDQEVHQFAGTEIRRQSSPITRTQLSEKESKIGGKLLQLSISGKEITNNYAG